MLLIYLPATTPRIDYIFDLIFNDIGIEYSTTANIEEFKEYDQEKINYSSNNISDELFIQSSSLLHERTIGKIKVPVETKNGMLVLFANENSGKIGFDIFAAIFYMVSRYEEYLPFSPDKHGRFKAINSIAYQNNFLLYPVVNIWIEYFKKALSEKFTSIRFSSSSFKAIVTYDIDIAYAYKGKNILRKGFATFKDILKLNFKTALARILYSRNAKDPWDTYDELMETVAENNLDSIFFFLLGDKSKYDRNINHAHPLMIDLIKKIKDFSEIGIHPSYKSSINTSKIRMEKTRLEEIANKEIIKSRQHYLRFFLPDTYNHLIEAGIKEDYSMGFADSAGFRAGTCKPFYFYDLKNEKATTLKIFPITFMEGNFLYYQKLKQKESLDIILNLINEVKKVDGTFLSIWHNNTISNEGFFKGWKWVHDEMIREISTKN